MLEAATALLHDDRSPGWYCIRRIDLVTLILDIERATWQEAAVDYDKQIARLKTKPVPVLCESGYMCSHCGTTLRADSPDFEYMANGRQVEAMTQQMIEKDRLIAEMRRDLDQALEVNKKLLPLATVTEADFKWARDMLNQIEQRRKHD